MLSLRVVKDPNYYTHLKYAGHGIEYYNDKKTNDKYSFWYGAYAEELGLTEKDVSKEDMLKVRASTNTKTRHKTTKNLGIDLTFSAPKSVSVAYAFTQDKKILKAHFNAVAKTLEIIEHEYAKTRYKGKEEPVEGIAVACFTHYTSRDLDPQLHTHAVVINAVKRKDGAITSLDARKLFKSQKEIGRIYRMFLAVELDNLGYKIEVKDEKDFLFELAIIPEPVVQEFSRARRRILKKARELEGKLKTRKAKIYELANLMTRPQKKDVSPDLLLDYWTYRLNRILPPQTGPELAL